MWHTISRRLTWASECQPIGCAITPLSDISIITASTARFTLKHRGAEMKTLSACLMQWSVSVCLALCLHIHSYVLSNIHIWFCFSLYVHASMLVFMSLFLPPLCFWLSLRPTSELHLIFLPICPEFASHLCVRSSGSEACLALKQCDVSAEKTVNMSWISAGTYVAVMKRTLVCVCV